MPKPNKGESESDFVSRCIPVVIEEGTTKDPKQAAAICHSLWSEGKKSAEDTDTASVPKKMKKASA